MNKLKPFIIVVLAALASCGPASSLASSSEELPSQRDSFESSSDQPKVLEPAAIFAQSTKPEEAEEYDIWVNVDTNAISVMFKGEWELQYSGDDGPLLPTDRLLRDDLVGMVTRAAARTVCAKSLTLSENYTIAVAHQETGSLWVLPQLITNYWCDQKHIRTAFVGGSPSAYEKNDSFDWADDEGLFSSLYIANYLRQVSFGPVVDKAHPEKTVVYPAGQVASVIHAFAWLSCLDEEKLERAYIADYNLFHLVKHPLPEDLIEPYREVFFSLDPTMNYLINVGFDGGYFHEEGETRMDDIFSFSFINQTEFEIPPRVIEDAKKRINKE